MQITLPPMSESAFAAFWETSRSHHARELMEEEQYSQKDALREAEGELRSMLPQGVKTPDNYLYSILAGGEEIGYLWFLTESTNGCLQAFLCDFYLVPAARGKGYGSAALERYHLLASDLGCDECVLFVADRNTAARRLYNRCGYSLLNRHNYGCFMKKPLSEERR